jgi:hypothetical protein
VHPHDRAHRRSGPDGCPITTAQGFVMKRDIRNNKRVISTTGRVAVRGGLSASRDRRAHGSFLGRGRPRRRRGHGHTGRGSGPRGSRGRDYSNDSSVRLARMAFGAERRHQRTWGPRPTGSPGPGAPDVPASNARHPRVNCCFSASTAADDSFGSATKPSRWPPPKRHGPCATTSGADVCPSFGYTSNASPASFAKRER